MTHARALRIDAGKIGTAACGLGGPSRFVAIKRDSTVHLFSNQEKETKSEAGEYDTCLCPSDRRGGKVAQLDNKRIAVLVTDGFEQVELTEPMKALQEAGAQVDIVSPKDDKVKGWDSTDWGDEVSVDVALQNAQVSDYDGLVLPGGQINPDKLRLEEKAVSFVRDFFGAHKPVAAICHGPWLLVEADVVRDRKVTSFPSIKTDLKNAGANWVDEEVVTDQGLVTSRNPDDLPAFNAKMIEEFAEGKHAEQTV